MKTYVQEFEMNAARAFFASAWADAIEESGGGLRGEIMDSMPDTIDPAAVHAARTLRMDVERSNASTIERMLCVIELHGAGDRPNTAEFFGHYAAMQSLGSGVGLYDAFGKYVHDTIKIPYVEFGSHSLERDYVE